MSNPNIKEIVRAYCKEHGYTGIVNLKLDDVGCGCPIENFPLCGDDCYDSEYCQAGYEWKDGAIRLKPEDNKYEM